MKMHDDIKIYYKNLNKDIKITIGTVSAMLFTYLCINLFDLIVNGKADW